MHIPASSNRRAGSDCIASRLANLPRFDLAAEQLSADAVPDEVWCLSASRLSPVLLADEGNPQVRPQGDNLECPGWESNPHVLFRTGDFKSPASAIPPPGPCGCKLIPARVLLQHGHCDCLLLKGVGVSSGVSWTLRRVVQLLHSGKRVLRGQMRIAHRHGNRLVP